MRTRRGDKRLWRLARWCAALCWMACLACAALTTSMAHAQSTPSDEPTAAPIDPGAAPEDGPDGVRTERGTEISRSEQDARLRRYIASGQQTITIDQIVSEMVDDFIADAKDLNMAAISPLALRGVGTSPNLSGAFGMWVDAELTNAVARHSAIKLKRCISCQALRTSVEGDDWVVTLGHIDQKELARTADEIGVKAYMDAFVAYSPGANVVSLNIQIYRAQDGKVLWAETYQSDATTAAILRSGDRIMTRDEAMEELNRKIEQRPYYGYQVLAGAGFIPYDSPTTSALSGAMIGGRLYEKWGEDKRFLYGFHGESFINLGENALLGAFLGATIQYELNEPNLNDPTYRVGFLTQGFVAGTEGNSFALEADFEAILQFRYGASIGAFYFFPTTFAGSDLGGPGLKARFIINW